MNLKDIFSQLPVIDSKDKVIVVLSGGLDSSTAAILLHRHYGPANVVAISFDYGQKQRIELQKAAELCKLLGIPHRILDLSILGEVAKPVSANIAGTNIKMPTIKEVLGEPQPVTYVPNRNMIMYSIAAAVAEAENAKYIFCGLQVHDVYGYWDTTQEWVDEMNRTLALNRKNKIEIVAPFAHLSKRDEIDLLRQMDRVHLLKHTLTCYNPDEDGKSCGKCPSCAERIGAFMQHKLVDPIEYQIDIKWIQ